MTGLAAEETLARVLREERIVESGFRMVEWESVRGEERDYIFAI